MTLRGVTIKDRLDLGSEGGENRIAILMNVIKEETEQQKQFQNYKVHVCHIGLY